MRDCRFVLTLVGTMALGTATGGASQTVPGVAQHMESPRAVFLQRVDAYVALHRRLEANLPPEVVTADPEALFLPQDALAREIRRERAHARQGEIFAPEVAGYLRVLITEALSRGGIEDFLAIVEEDQEDDDVRLIPTVNGEYPAGASISFMPPCLLEALPPLPKELEYRFLARDLILWDLHAGLIVDFLPRAFAEITVPACVA
jgi:hypothetical protein